MEFLSNKEKLDLKKLVNESECENNTEYIRKLKHSDKILQDVRLIEQLKLKKNDFVNEEEYILNSKEKAFFLFNTYPDIFNRLIKDELNILILSKLLNILKLIEDGEVDQHEGSALVGKLLKTLYLDSAVKHGENLDKKYKTDTKPVVKEKNITWKDWKRK
jgi:hypothetical protein